MSANDIMEFLKHCRLCFSSQGPMKQIAFNAPQNNRCSLYSVITSKIISGLTSVNIFPEDHLPQIVCKKCDDFMNDFLDFKDRCITTNQKLHQYWTISLQSQLAALKYLAENVSEPLMSSQNDNCIKPEPEFIPAIITSFPTNLDQDICTTHNLCQLFPGYQDATSPVSEVKVENNYLEAQMQTVDISCLEGPLCLKEENICLSNGVVLPNTLDNTLHETAKTVSDVNAHTFRIFEIPDLLGSHFVGHSAGESSVINTKKSVKRGYRSSRKESDKKIPNQHELKKSNKRGSHCSKEEGDKTIPYQHKLKKSVKRRRQYSRKEWDETIANQRRLEKSVKLGRVSKSRQKSDKTIPNPAKLKKSVTEKCHSSHQECKKPVEKKSNSATERRLCSICGQSFYNTYCLNKHMKMHEYADFSNSKRICKTCGYETRSNHFLLLHLLNVHNVNAYTKKFECSTCGERFSLKFKLQRHIVSVHLKEKFICEECGIELTSHYQLSYHINKKHRLKVINKTIKCQICLKMFVQKEGLTKHMRTHTGETPYKCSFCDRPFTLKQNLDAHLRLHTGDKPYKCEVCGLAFRHNVSKKNHMKYHKDVPGVVYTPPVNNRKYVKKKKNGDESVHDLHLSNLEKD